MDKIPFDPSSSTIEDVRNIFIKRLRSSPDWDQIEPGVNYFDDYIEYKDEHGARLPIGMILEVFWQLVIEGVLIPGKDTMNKFPFFRRTEYGNRMISETTPTPHETTIYISYINNQIPNFDLTVMRYLQESLLTFRSGNLVASSVMIGVAAERVFLLICEDLLKSLNDKKEQNQFKNLINKFPMRPKLEWVHNKLISIQKKNVGGFPENAITMITAVYDFIRYQRNELGHPQNKPPVIDRESVFVDLQIFPKYYKTAEQLRDFLRNSSV